MHRLLSLLVASSIIGSAAGDSTIHVLVSSATAPAGSTVQIQFSLAKPQSLASGELTVDLDPIFGAVTAVAAFSAAGDAYGFATVDGHRVDVKFWSPSGSIGQIAGNPIVALTVGISPDAASGTRAAITADPSGSPWSDTARATYPVTIGTGAITIGGALSVANVQPGTGIVPAGTTIRVDGTGFSAATSVDIQSAAVFSTAFVSPTRIDVTLGGPTEISGKRIRLRNADGAQVDFFPSWRGDPLSSSSKDPYFNALPILPLQAYTQAASGAFRLDSGWLVLQNPNPEPVDVALQALYFNASYLGQTLVRIPAGGSSYQSVAALGLVLENAVRVVASAPIRILELTAYTNFLGAPPYVPQRSVNVLQPIDLGPLRVEADRNEDSLSWTWQAGSARPGVKNFHVYSPDRQEPVAFTVSVATESGGRWLSATPAPPPPCAITSCPPPEIGASVDPTGLAPGIYRGSITLAPVTTTVRPDALPTVVAVALTVTAAQAVINTVALIATFVSPGPPNYSPTLPYNLSSDVFPGRFSVTVRTDGGGNWLSATPSTGTAPAVLMVSANLTGLARGRYSGEVIVTGSGNTMVIPASVLVYGGVQLRADYPLRFAVRVGDPAPPAQIASVVPECIEIGCPPNGVPAGLPFAALVKTNSGGDWLAALPSAGSLSVSVNPAALAPGIYTGAITLTSSAVSGSTQIPVILTVWTGSAPALSASPSSVFSLWQGVGGAYICLSTGSLPVATAARAATRDGGNWLKVTLTNPVTFTCGLTAASDGSKLAPGTYTGSILVTIPDQSLSIPVTLVVPPPPRLLLGSVLNGASAIQGAVAPGEIVAIHGVGVGPQTAAGFATDSRGKVVTDLQGAQILFDEIPAPLIYASASQVNAIVPYEVAGRTAVHIQTRFNGLSTGWTVPVASAAPAIFTLDASGGGAAAVLNQDNSVNGPANPAARGSVIQIFATGVNVPGAVTGGITSGASPYAGAPLSVTLSGIDAFIQYAGPAPGAVAGLFQVNAIVPAGVAPGSAVPIHFSVGSLQSQSGTTIAVQ